MMTVFCRERGIPTAAAVPGLVEHGDASSLAGHESHGERRSTVLDEHRPPTAHWEPEQSLLPGLTAHAAFRWPAAFTVELRNSCCLLRFLRPGTAELVEHPFGWYWHDWCSLVDVDPNRVLATEANQRQAGGPAPAAVASEVWAAGYLLGAASAGYGPQFFADATLRRRLLRHAAGTWIDSGVLHADMSGPGARGFLVAHCYAAVDAGRRDGMAAHV